jgi:hypothetical protein
VPPAPVVAVVVAPPVPLVLAVGLPLLALALVLDVVVAAVVPPLPPVPAVVEGEVAEQAAITVPVRLTVRSKVPYFTVTPGNPCGRARSRCCVVDLAARSQ